MNKYSRTFTLIEMLIVIVIIGILATALIPRLSQMQARARNTARKSHLSQTLTAVYSYTINVGNYPYHLGLLTSGGYMTSVPSDPSVSTNNSCGTHPNAAFNNSRGFYTGYGSCVGDGEAYTDCIGYKGYIYTHGWALSHGAVLAAQMENDGSLNSHGYQGLCAWVDFANWGGVGGLTQLPVIKAAANGPLTTKGGHYHVRIEYK